MLPSLMNAGGMSNSGNHRASMSNQLSGRAPPGTSGLSGPPVSYGMQQQINANAGIVSSPNRGGSGLMMPGGNHGNRNPNMMNMIQMNNKPLGMKPHVSALSQPNSYPGG